MKTEPVISWTVIAAILNGLQLPLLPVAPWLHIVILIVLQVVAALAARQKVTPIPPQ